MTLAEFIAELLMRAHRNAELRAAAARAGHTRPGAAVVPAGMPMPYPVRDVGGHDASGEGRAS